MAKAAQQHTSTRRPHGVRARGGSGSERGLDRYDLYEMCVQDAVGMARFLRAVHGGKPRVMREDFCGGGAVAREWASLGQGYRAIGVDRDREPLAWLARRARLTGVGRRVRAVCADVMACDLPPGADVISATNFPIGYWHTRQELVRYLRATLRRLKPGGVFVCDTYGGESAMRRMKTRRVLGLSRLPGRRVEYTWEQREADPVTGRVLDVLHFRVVRGRKVVQNLPEAFVYDWRLWSIAELREAMGEAGFAAVEVYDRLADAVDGEGQVYVRPAEKLAKDWVVYGVGRR